MAALGEKALCEERQLASCPPSFHQHLKTLPGCMHSVDQRYEQSVCLCLYPFLSMDMLFLNVELQRVLNLFHKDASLSCIRGTLDEGVQLRALNS